MVEVLLLCLMFLLTPSTVESLRLKMIHRDSIDSPFYPRNLTTVEKLRRLDNYSIATVQYYRTMLSRSDFNTEQLRPRVTHHSSQYIVELTVGTRRGPRRQVGGSHKSNKFSLDTGSGLLWLQCNPCHNSSRQGAHFDPAKSSTYRPVHCDHPLCDLNQHGWACIEDRCHYTYSYALSKAAIGFLGSELIGFSSNPDIAELIDNLVFGCTHEIQGNFALVGDIDGMLGFNPLPFSLITQIQHHVGGHQFAYCLTSLAPSPLLLGHEAVLHSPRLKTIRVSWFPRLGHVYLPLRDVSIGNHRINFPRGTSEPQMVGDRAHGHGGFIVDSGAAVTYFSSGGPYELVRAAFMNYFQHHPVAYAGQLHRMELCYHHRGFSDFPNMVLHFGAQDFIVAPENLVWVVDDHTFCIAIRQMEGYSLLGAYQQTNHWMLFNYARRTLSYAPVDCSRYA